MKSALLSLAIAGLVLPGDAAAHAESPHGNFELRIQGRYDFHTWLWAVSSCPGDCVNVQAIPQPVAKAFPYNGDAQLVDGRYVLCRRRAGRLALRECLLRTGDTHQDVYSWDATTRAGMCRLRSPPGAMAHPAGR